MAILITWLLSSVDIRHLGKKDIPSNHSTMTCNTKGQWVFWCSDSVRRKEHVVVLKKLWLEFPEADVQLKIHMPQETKNTAWETDGRGRSQGP